ncbi:hypothetical protein GJ496_010878 [Pomphorhynchus laevis]|nr:hypothetical protein GJ496_010878 [Pomphorhynchus laevis]
MWPYGRSQDDLTYHWNRPINSSGGSNTFLNSQQHNSVSSQPSAAVRFGSQPVLRDCWLPNFQELTADRSDVSLCLQNTTASTRNHTFSENHCDVSSFLEPPTDIHGNLTSSDFDFCNVDYTQLNGISITPSLTHNSISSEFDPFIYLNDIISENIPKSDICWTDDPGRNARSAPPSPLPDIRKRCGSSHTCWSDMNNEEQMKIVENLTSIVNSQMDVFEQLEIIRILKPDAKLMKDSNQFTIELSMLDNHKFRHIRDLLRLQGIPLEMNQQGDRMSEQSGGSSIQNRCYTKQDIRLSRQKRFLKLRQRKDRLQQAREERSGLFEYNETLSLKSNLSDEENDIDIIS